MYTQTPVASDGFILNLLDTILLFCKPFTSKFSDFWQQFPKINVLYLIDDRYGLPGTKIEKIDNDIVNNFLTSSKETLFTGITM